MVEQEAGKHSGRLAGWIKAAGSGLCGLVGGALLMSLTPLVDRVLKPPKPVANFAVELQGAQATFQDRSSGGYQGWWDFGDGSPLEPYSPTQHNLPHDYARPGTYTAKLSLSNLLGDANDRAVTVQIETPAAGPAEIAVFQVLPTRADNYAPATFHVTATIKNADLCIFSDGAGQPMEVQPRPPEDQEHYVTFKQPGRYTIKLAAVQGTQVVERTAIVHVEAPRPGTAVAVLNVTREAARVETVEARRNVPVVFPAKHTGSTFAFEVDVPVSGGQITAVRLTNACTRSPSVKDAKVVIAPDKSRVLLSGQLVKPSGGLFGLRSGPAPTWVAEVVLTERRRSATVVRPTESYTALLNLSGPTVMKIPPLLGGQVVKQRITVDVSDGTQQALKNLGVPASGTIVLQNRPWQLTASQQGDQVRIDLHAVSAGTGLSGN